MHNEQFILKRGPGNMKFLSALCLCLVLANLELGQGASLAQGETNIDIYIYLHPLYLSAKQTWKS